MWLCLQVKYESHVMLKRFHSHIWLSQCGLWSWTSSLWLAHQSPDSHISTSFLNILQYIWFRFNYERNWAGWQSGVGAKSFSLSLDIRENYDSALFETHEGKKLVSPICNAQKCIYVMHYSIKPVWKTTQMPSRSGLPKLAISHRRNIEQTQAPQTGG